MNRPVKAAAIAAVAFAILLPISCETVETIDLTYRLEWDLAGVDLDDGSGWALTSDLGYRVHVDRAWLVSFAIQLVACEDPPEKLSSVFAPRSAWAGHGGVLGEAALPDAFVEDLARPVDVEVGRLQDVQVRLCQAHWLIARADEGAIGLPEDVDLERRSVWIEGTWIGPDGGEPTPFSIVSTKANGRLLEVDGDSLGPAPTVSFQRRLGTLFDGIEFATANSRSLQKSVLTNLIDGFTVEIR